MGGVNNLLEVLAASTKLGLTSFGGPVAHIGYFHQEYVVRRKWLDDHTYFDLVALCQFLPGPGSSQIGLALGLLRAGPLGALAAWLGFTLPSAVALVAFAYGVERLAPEQSAGWIHGLKIVAVAVVAQALWSMARTLCPDRERISIALLACIGILAWPLPLIQAMVIALGGVIGWRFLRTAEELQPVRLPVPYGRRLGAALLVVFIASLIALPVARQLFPSHALSLFDSFYRSGSLVFGGGHVVLSLLQAEVIPPGWVSNEQFLAGYGAAQAVPGPLFTFSAYLGAVMGPEPNGWQGAAIALVAIFLPSFFLVFGILPFWDDLRARSQVRSALGGVNAAVVGILLAALYTPLWTSAIVRPPDFALGIAAFGLLMFWRVPPLVVVLFCAVGGYGLGFM
ncbi:MAG: chromate efflux transporter [Dehalococcoidia bacterium]|nr:chromate efflux transporter [Dehalococcoidia bacterium]